MDTLKIGNRIREARLNCGMSQQNVADKMDVSYQSVSLWENGNLPTCDKLIKLSEILGVSLSSLVEDRNESLNKTAKMFFNPDNMFTFIKGKAEALNMTNTFKALPVARKAHEHQFRKSTTKSNDEKVPYIYHPLSLACCLLSMGIVDDEIIAAAVLHDVLEDCVMITEGKHKGEMDSRNYVIKNKFEYRDLIEEDLKDVNENVRHLVSLLTHDKEDGKNRDKVMNAYFKGIAKEPKAALIKCADRINNLGSTSWGLSRERMYRQIVETEKYFPQLLKVLKGEPEYNDIAWQFTYQMKTLLDIYKRLM
ncbi:MAG: XRE family transcriptional regulator [Erysipelotrichaceae bacterium]|nr:XRE family transcriptional regulator [Erysipelotrichaceae bacterium]